MEKENNMSGMTLPEEVTKHGFRKRMWDYMMKNELANFPLSVHNRIPNFDGNAEAALKLSELDEFKRARTVKVNPDKPQETVRFLCLEANKNILVPIPRLKSGLFQHVVPPSGATKEELKIAATRRGLEQWGKPVGLDLKMKIDLVVLGSVCVSPKGYRIGKGEGFADLEYALMSEMGAVNDDTVVVTTVHDCQIVNDLPAELFQKYDVPVDIIVTPSQTIIVNPKLRKPDGIIWNILSERRLKSMPILQRFKEIQEKEGKVIVLKEVDSDVGTSHYERDNRRRLKVRRRTKSKQEGTDSEAARGDKEEGSTPRFSKRKQNWKRRGDGDYGSPTGRENETEAGREKSGQRRRPLKPRSKPQIDFSLKLSNIAPDVRVRDLKNALIVRGVKPSDITWRGHQGFCYLHFGKLRNEKTELDQPTQVDSIVANLQEMHIGESEHGEKDYVVVEPAKPITRIEVTDVTSV
ncbi:methenyltetrahydrofolate synthase domain-containing protein [Diprion similis]|uniref:methenyltetrahydrofolate synthase domain-containing protein n=1 Tax=Diprion similis TaxID=362088 RepID=UPI001EF9A0D9|nr:methenyltetrahydrofolate synthase domain-containing protein [Diprion similis]